MANRFIQNLKNCFTRFKHFIHIKETPLALAPLEEKEKSRRSTITKNVYVETTNKRRDKTQVLLVEVESFQNHEAGHAVHPLVQIRNYTQEGEDPNLRITHFPPSNRLH